MSSSLLSTLSASWAELSWLIASLFQCLAVAPMSKRAAQLEQISCKSYKWKWSKVYPVKGNRLSWSWLRNFSALLSRYLAAKQTACLAFSYLWMMYIPCNVPQSELSLGISQAICYCFFSFQPQSYPTLSSSYHSVNLLNCLPHTQSQLTHPHTPAQITYWVYSCLVLRLSNWHYSDTHSQFSSVLFCCLI